MTELSDEVGRIIADEGADNSPPSPKAKRGRKKKSEQAEFNYQPNETSIRACIILSDVVMRVVCRLAKWNPLTEEEAGDIGKALDPVMQKHMPALSRWGEEVALGMVLLGVIMPRMMGGQTEEAEEGPVIVVDSEEKSPPIDSEAKDVTAHTVVMPPVATMDW